MPTSARRYCKTKRDGVGTVPYELIFNFCEIISDSRGRLSLQNKIQSHNKTAVFRLLFLGYFVFCDFAADQAE